MECGSSLPFNMSSQESSDSSSRLRCDSCGSSAEDLQEELDIYHVQQLQEVGELMSEVMDPSHKDRAFKFNVEILSTSLTL